MEKNDTPRRENNLTIDASEADKEQFTIDPVDLEDMEDVLDEDMRDLMHMSEMAG